MNALAKHGCPWALARRISRVVTYRSKRGPQRAGRTVPQGAPTSSHVANIVLDSMLRRNILPYAAERGVVVRNYGDDIAFSGDRADQVRACVRRAQQVFKNAGFSVSSTKTVVSEHRGGRRWFIGCATGRHAVDCPRQKYRMLRKELRGVLNDLRKAAPGEMAVSERTMNSFRQRIAYVRRLNRHKARRLADFFHRICAENRRLRLGRLPNRSRGAVA